MTINVTTMENNYLELQKRNAYDLFETYNGDDKEIIQERLKKLDRKLNQIENARVRDDYQAHKLLSEYAAISDDCKKTVSTGGFFERLKKLIAA